MEEELKRAEKMAEVQRLKTQREEAQQKAREDMEAAKKAREERAAQAKEEMEEARRAVRREKDRLRREKEKFREASSQLDEEANPGPKIPVINAVPLSTVLPPNDPGCGPAAYTT